MATIPISLSVTRDARFAPAPGHTGAKDTSAGMARLRATVIQQARHQRRCAGCDFAFGTSDQYELHHVDGNHANNDTANIVPMCEICHAAFHLDLVTRRWGDAPGHIIYLPEVSQGQLNNLLQAIFFAKLSQQKGAMKSIPEVSSPANDPLAKVHSLHIDLERRAELVESLPDGSLGRPGLSQPSVLARVLGQMSEEDYARRDTLLFGLRYLPAESTLLKAAEDWDQHGAGFAQLEVAQWAAIAGVVG